MKKNGQIQIFVIKLLFAYNVLSVCHFLYSEMNMLEVMLLHFG